MENPEPTVKGNQEQNSVLNLDQAIEPETGYFSSHAKADNEIENLHDNSKPAEEEDVSEEFDFNFDFDAPLLGSNDTDEFDLGVSGSDRHG